MGHVSVPKRRIDELRHADVERRINADVARMNSFIYGLKPYSRLRLALSWDERKGDFWAWHEKTVLMCKARLRTLEARLVRARKAAT